MSESQKIIVKILNVLNTLFIIFCVIIIPIVLLWIGLELSNTSKKTFITQFIIIQENWWKWSIIFSGFLVIVFRAVVVKIYDKEELKDIIAEIKFITSHAKTAWSIGAGLACIITGIFFFIPTGNGLHERFGTIFGIFVSVLGITLAVHVLYRQMAPIIGTTKLLDSLIKDLENCSQQTSIWLVYPALNIGFYRALKNGENVWKETDNFNYKHTCGQFHRTLQHTLQDKDPKAIAITYPEDKYDELYVTYDEMIRSDVKDEDRAAMVEKCVKSSQRLIEIFKEEGNRKNQNIKFVEIDPDKFPQHLVIIGDIVYFIVSYGLPLYNHETGEFIPIKGEHKPADLLTWRREDSVLAQTITAHLEKSIDQFPNTDLEKLNSCDS